MLKLDYSIEHELCQFAFHIKENTISKPILALFSNNLSNIVINVNTTLNVNRFLEVKQTVTCNMNIP